MKKSLIVTQLAHEEKLGTVKRCHYPALSPGARTLCLGIATLLVGVALSACSEDSPQPPTRTPVPTWTATLSAAEQAAANAATPVQNQGPAQAADTATEAPAPPAAATDTPPPATTDTPTPEPTATLTPEPTATIDYAFELETAEKFPTDSLAPNMVRVNLFVYNTDLLGLGGYRLRVTHNGADLVVDAVSADGVPKTTSDKPGPYTRFTNMNAVFVESQSGRWEVQLLDPNGAPVGPMADFDLTADENTRELYVRYRLK
ncbi:MAG: hypothetical protein U0175_03905 [Caldilineaceae bacterium]